MAAIHSNRRRWLGLSGRAAFVYGAVALASALIAELLMFAFGYASMCADSLDRLHWQAMEIVRQEQQTGDTLTVPSWQQMHVYQHLSRALIFFVDRDYVAIHVEADDDTPDDKRKKELTLRTQVMDALDRQFIARVLMGEQVLETHHFALAKGEALFVGIPMQNEEGKVLGALILLSPVYQKQLFFKVFWQTFGCSVLAVAILALAASRRFTANVGRPMEAISSTVRQLSEGKLDARVELRGEGEIGGLVRSVNALSARMRDNVADMMEERDQLRIIVAGIEEGIGAADTSGNLVRYNQAFLELMEIESIEALEDAQGDGPATLNELMRACLFSRKRQRGVWTSPSGRNILALISPLLSNNGEILGGVALLQDVSESERLEQLRRDYIANISHELRTPLTGIRGMVEPLLDGYIETEAEKKDCYEVIYRETLRLEKLIGDMLDVSRLQNGHIQLELERLEVGGIIEAALRRVRGTARAAGISLLSEVPGSELACIGDENRILQVITIFLDNALSFTPEGGSVLAYARVEGAQLRIGVRDTGVGIEPKDLPFIWERFYKSDKSRMRTSGTGLGLAIAKLVVELMDGEIGVESQVGRGSDFYFLLKRG